MGFQHHGNRTSCNLMIIKALRSRYLDVDKSLFRGPRNNDSWATSLGLLIVYSYIPQKRL